MKKSELLLLFTTIIISVVILVMALFYFIKPSKNSILINDKDSIKKEIKQKNNDGWIDKISKKNKTFSYPVVIYKIIEGE